MSQLVPSAGFLYESFIDEHTNYYGNMYSMYPSAGANMSADFWDVADEKNLLVSSLDGLHSGVPTRTTPTLTPTTLRSIEQTFLDFTSESGSHSREAGFVPPIIEPSQPTPAQTQNNNIHLQQPQQQQQQQIQPQQQQQQQQQQQHQQHNNVLVEIQQTQLQAQQQQQQQQPQPQQQTRRNMGGRRPTRTVGMSPEEEERRQIRRERNKMAAARCRKRRLDHTNSLLEETEGLEQKKQSLQNEIAELQHAKDELEFMLEAHRAVCRLQSSSPPDVKPVIDKQQQALPPTTNNNNFQPEEFVEIPCNAKQQQQQQQQSNEEQLNGLRQLNRPNTLPIFTEPKPRPSSLHIKTVETPAFMKTAAEVVGVPITTPSSGIPFNFDSLMEGGTGLTPVSTPLIPSCSSQQRNNVVVSAVDLSSPDANPPKLVSL